MFLPTFGNLLLDRTDASFSRSARPEWVDIIMIESVDVIIIEWVDVIIIKSLISGLDLRVH